MSKLKRVYGCPIDKKFIMIHKCETDFNFCPHKSKLCNKLYYLVPVEGTEIIPFKVGSKKNDGLWLFIPAKKEKGND